MVRKIDAELGDIYYVLGGPAVKLLRIPNIGNRLKCRYLEDSKAHPMSRKWLHENFRKTKMAPVPKTGDVLALHVSALWTHRRKRKRGRPPKR